MMKCKLPGILMVFLFLYLPSAKAQDSLVTAFNKYFYEQGDSMQVEAWIEGFKKGGPPKTLNLWVDNTVTGKRWKFRYPFLNGHVKFSLKIGKDIPKAAYAFNFLVQEDFFNVKGRVVSGNKHDSSLNYMVTAKYKRPVIDNVDLKAGKEFEIRDLYFSGQAIFAFSAPIKRKSNELELKIRTPLDSSFIPAMVLTEPIYVGYTESAAGTLWASGNYKFALEGFGEGRLLENITIKGKLANGAQQSSNPVINEGDARTIDLTQGDEHLSYPDLMTYLTFKFPNLKIRFDPETGRQFLMQRNEVVDIYVDEYLDTDFHPSTVSITDVTMIKYFVQGLRIGGGINDNGLGGSIVIYTRKAGHAQSNKPSGHVFLLNGYSPFKAEWKN